MLLTSGNLPDTIPDIEALDELLCRPSQTLIDDLGKVDGDIIILGVAGKMGPTLAGLAKAALPHGDTTVKPEPGLCDAATPASEYESISSR